MALLPFGDIAARRAQFLFVAPSCPGHQSFGDGGLVEFVEKRFDDFALDFVEIIAASVVTGAAFLHGRTDDPTPPGVNVVRRHAAAAGAAAQQPGEDTPAVSVGSDAARPGFGVFAGLCGFESLPIDDAQVRRVGILPFALGIDARDALAGRWIANHANAIPDDPPIIDRIEQNAVSAREIAVDRRSVPTPPARRCDPVAVQAGGDVARGFSRHIFGKDAPNDLRFLFHDLKLANFTGRWPVAISAPTGAAALAHDASHAPPDFLYAVFAEKLPDHPAQANRNGVGDALIHCDDFDADKRETLVDAGEVFHIAGETIERLDDDDFKPASARLFKQLCEPVATNR